MCSLGLLTKERNKGIAKLLVQHLIDVSTQPLYLVCIIPEFFTPFNFKIVNEYPPELQNKLEYCIHNLVVEEEYVVMKYFN